MVSFYISAFSKEKGNESANQYEKHGKNYQQNKDRLSKEKQKVKNTNG